MVIKAENTKFEKEFTVSGHGGPSRRKMGLGDEPQAPRPATRELELPDGIEPGGLEELQFAMHEVSTYAGKGTPAGIQTMRDVLLKASAALSVEVTEQQLGAALAALILLSDEAGYSIDAIAHKKLTGMVTR